MKKRLEKCGIRSINNVVDVTNYVLLEFGHPLHAFDLKTLKGNTIRIGTPMTIEGKSGIKFKTLDGTERDIPGDSLMIWDIEKPVAVAVALILYCPLSKNSFAFCRRISW